MIKASSSAVLLLGTLMGCAASDTPAPPTPLSAAQAQAPLTPSPAGSDGPMIPMTGTVQPAIKDIAPATPHDPRAPITFDVYLRSHDPEAEARFTHASEDPHSPMFRKTLTPQELDAMTRPSPEAIDATKAWAGRHGLVVVEVRGPSIRLTGTTAAIQSALTIVINDYDLPTHGGRFHAADRDPTIPAALPISAILGLDDIPIIKRGPAVVR